jgi:hypothetical protein
MLWEHVWLGQAIWILAFARTTVEYPVIPAKAGIQGSLIGTWLAWASNLDSGEGQNDESGAA